MRSILLSAALAVGALTLAPAPQAEASWLSQAMRGNYGYGNYRAPYGGYSPGYGYGNGYRQGYGNYGYSQGYGGYYSPRYAAPYQYGAPYGHQRGYYGAAPYQYGRQQGYGQGYYHQPGAYYYGR